MRPNAEVIGPDRVGKDDYFGMPTNRAPVNLPSSLVSGRSWLVVFTKNGRWPRVGVFFDQGFVGWAIRVKFCIGSGLSIFHQGCFGSTKSFPSSERILASNFGLRQ